MQFRPTRRRAVRAGIALLASASAAMLACAAEPSTSERRAGAGLRDAGGRDVGQVELRATPDGVLLRVSVDGLPPGEHALHIHERGECEPPFDSAGGHFAPQGRVHGFLEPDGAHAGDLPNLHVPASGRLEVELLSHRLALSEGEGDLFDADGSAVVVHAGPDDYESQPAGAAGKRIACGVIAARDTAHATHGQEGGRAP